MTLPEARQRYESADRELWHWSLHAQLAQQGTAVARDAFLRLDIARTKRQEALAELLRAVDA